MQKNATERLKKVDMHQGIVEAANKEVIKESIQSHLDSASYCLTPRVVTDTELLQSCLYAAASNEELLNEFDRLTGSNVSGKGSAIAQKIDRVTGRLEADAKAFYAFVLECIYLPVQARVNADREKAKRPL